MMAVQQIHLEDKQIVRDPWLNRTRRAIHRWRPCYRFVSRHLTMSDKRDGGDALRWIEQTIEWDKEHRVRYWLWRFYINIIQPTDLVKDHVTRPIKRFWQRGRRGWCYEDVWNVDNWLARTLPDMLDRLRKQNHGWPGEPMTFEEWNGDGGIIDQIATGFRAARVIENLDYGGEGEPTYDELRATFDHGFDLFKEWYFQLWD